MLDKIKKSIRSFLGCQEIDITILKREIMEELKPFFLEAIKNDSKTAALEAYECKINRYWIQDTPDNAPLVKNLIKNDVNHYANVIINERMTEYNSEVFLDKVVERIRNKQVN